ncbi:RHS repeat-associated core domain-containing protein [Chishuiella changwenlii]|uniref:Cell wall-associated protein n=1 Tax=Chishuiella changwenlii TaxID=1434701 RepID=A0A1M7D1L5_9FLAO|nr:DUF6443 domain-containing protein [Chishuiella changwenlii]GGF10657.1 cell wall-associated protein [Chishuiella changwenlii]SHL73344.1 RHS repeat-associated core domain-containing protein [Chishuiella changwenlii]
MRKFYNLFLILFVGSSFSFAQKVLNTPTAENSTITDPVSITMTPGFSVKSVSGSTFRAFIDSNGNGIPDGQEAELPTLNENFVRTIECLNASCSKKKETVVYFDGLGREKQALQVAASPTGKTIITPFDYDGFGRQEKEFLPFPISSTDNKISTQTDGTSFYGTLTGDTTPYSQKTFENSPLNRVLFQAAPGESWKKGSSHEIGFKYELNTENDVLRFDVSLSQTLVPSLVPNGSYQANTLYKTVTTDENGQAIQEFKDQEGRVILKRINILQEDDAPLNSSGKHDTYYVYDVYGNLTYVLPPKLIEVGNYIDNLAELGYQYQYDDKNRLVEKQLPGKGREFMVYDNQDRLTLQQDANQRTATNKGWTFFKYDKFGRIVYSGFFKNTATRSAMQSALSSKRTLNNEERTSTVYSNNGTTIYYTNSQFPNGSLTVQTVNYYDNYENLEILPSAIDNQTVIGASDTKTKGLAVATLTNVLGTATWNKSYTFYDKEYVRPVASHSENYLKGHTSSASSLDFRGKALNTVTKHKLDDINTPEITINEVFDYYDNELLKSQTHQINNGPVEYIAQNSYNEINQLVSKKVGNDNVSTPLQTVDYKYNIRGWMTDINNIDVTNDDLFSFRIKYNNPYYNGEKLYNGNISEVLWKTSPNERILGYMYNYDGLNRLLKGTFINPSTQVHYTYNEHIKGYDKNGNILGIDRNSQSKDGNVFPIDDLAYTYQNHSNKLLAVTDRITGPDGFDDKNKTGDDYDYDLNGNLIKDLNKEITKITYNDLNLPIEVLWENGNKISYLYDANGVKLKKTLQRNLMSEPIETYYIDGFQYKKGNGKFDFNPKLQFFPTTEGYVNVSGSENEFQYVYNYTDHLGNVRLSYQKENNGSLKILEENNYYPFGLKHKGYTPTTIGNSNYQYKYNGKELQTDLDINLYDYGARNYDPAIGRWFNVDPLAEKYQELSPYTYAVNNPVFFIDPDGMQVEHDYQLLKNGQVKLIKETADKSDTLYATNNDGSINKNESVTVQKEKASDTSVIGDLANANGYLGNFRNENANLGAKKGEVRIGYSNNVNDAVNVFNFLNKNTFSNIEFGLMRFENNGNNENYLIGTNMEIDDLGKTFRSMINKIGGYSNLIAFYHNHDGYVGSNPDKIGNQFGADQNTRRFVQRKVIEAGGRKLPRFFTIHEGLGNTLIELNRDGHIKTGMVMTPGSISNINKK